MYSLNYHYKLILLVLVSAGLLHSCISPRAFLPSVSEEIEMIRKANLSPSKRFAVVTLGSFVTTKLDNVKIGEHVAPGIAKVTQNMLGVQANALDQSSTGAWAKEIVHAGKKGLVKSARDAFIDRMGFDGYVLVFTNNEHDDWDDNPDRTYWNVYRPYFQIHLKSDSGVFTPLMRTDLDTRMTCDLKVYHDSKGFPTGVSELMEPEECTKKFVDLYRAKLSSRLLAE